MKTVITSRKTPHAAKTDLFGDKFVMQVWAWCFENGNLSDRLIRKRIPICRCYVKSGRQHIPDNELTLDDVRPYHVDVWNAKSKNLKKHGFFKVDYELDEFLVSLYERTISTKNLLIIFG